MSSSRLKFILEGRGMSRVALATELSRGLENVKLDEAPGEEVRERVNGELLRQGRPAMELSSWAEVYDAFIDDVDGDGAVDFDYEAAAQAGVAVGLPRNVRFEQTIVKGDDESITADPWTLTVPVRLTRDAEGRLSPFTGDVPAGSTPIAELKVRDVGGPVLQVGDELVRLTWPLELKGLPAADSAALVERILSARLPADSALAPGLKRLAEQKLLKESAVPPADLALAVAWRASRLTPERLEAATAQLKQRYGVRPLRYTGYVNEVHEAPLARAVLDAARPQNGITPAFLYAVAMGEGLNRWADLLDVGPHRPVDGFLHLGVDTFATRAADLKRRLLLPQGFTEGADYQVAERVNEKGETVQSATFPDVTRGLVALNAMLADERRRFLRDAREVLGDDAAQRLTQEHINYFTYVYFNAGAGFGKQHLQARGLSAIEPWRGDPPGTNRVARYNALQRVATWRLVEGTRIFG